MQNNTNQEALLGPPRIDIASVGISALASFVAGAVGGIFVLICTFLFLGTAQESASAIFPYVLALVGLIAILLTVYVQAYFGGLIFPEKYVRRSQETAQIFGFNLLMFILFTPLYVYVGGARVDLLMMVFCVHALTTTLGSVLIGEIIAQYRYSLLALYSSFIGFFSAAFISFILFASTTISTQILFSLSSVLVVSIFAQTLFRTVFEYLYYKIYSLTGLDLLGNAFSEIQADELARVHEAEKALTQFQ